MPVGVSAKDESWVLDIVMPFYGRKDHLQSAVRSVIAQSDPRWRLVIVDDAYPDVEPGRWARKLGDPRIVYLRNKVNLGVSANFQRCVDLVTAKYAVVIGCDDCLLPNYVELVRSLAGAFPDAAIIQPGVEVIDQNGAHVFPLADRVKSLVRPRSREPREHAGDRLAAGLLRGAWTYFPSLCWKASELKRHPFRANFDVVLDLAVILEIIADGGTMVVDDTPAFLYRRHAASVSSWKATDGSRFAQELELFRESERIFSSLGWARSARAARWHITSRLNAVTNLPRALRSGGYADGRRLAIHALGTLRRSDSG